MQLPVDWKGSPNADPNEVLGVVMAEAASFTSGLSISFGENGLNVTGSYVPPGSSNPLAPGERGPDVDLIKPGTFESTRLHKETPNMARFYAVVFAGQPDETSPALAEFAQALSMSKLFNKASLPISWLTIPATSGPSAYELLGMKPFGKVFYDEKQTAHQRYGIDVKEGGVALLRPDGWLGTLTALNGDAIEELERYFKETLIV